jgi:hypothetical protein
MLVVTSASAKDPIEWVKQLNSGKEAERTEAIEALRKDIAKNREALIKIEANESLEPRQLLILRRLLAEPILAASALPPVDLKDLKPLGEDKTKNEPGDGNILLNAQTKIIALPGEFALEQGPLEFLVVSRGPNARLHETITVVRAIPRNISLAFLSCAYTYAGELGEDGKVNLPKGAGVLVSVQFDFEPAHANMDPDARFERANDAIKGVERKTIRVPIEAFAWNNQTESPMRRAPFAFTGSRFERDENKKMVFMADVERSVVAVKLDGNALLNTPLDTRSLDPQHTAGYGVHRHTTPMRGTKCTVVFEPWTGELKEEDLKDTGDKSKAPAPPPQQPGL